MSFAGIKADNLEDAKSQIKLQIAGLYEQNRECHDAGTLLQGSRIRRAGTNEGESEGETWILKGC